MTALPGLAAVPPLGLAAEAASAPVYTSTLQPSGGPAEYPFLLLVNSRPAKLDAKD